MNYFLRRIRVTHSHQGVARQEVTISVYLEVTVDTFFIHYLSLNFATVLWKLETNLSDTNPRA